MVRREGLDHPHLKPNPYGQNKGDRDDDNDDDKDDDNDDDDGIPDVFTEDEKEEYTTMFLEQLYLNGDFNKVVEVKNSCLWRAFRLLRPPF